MAGGEGGLGAEGSVLAKARGGMCGKSVDVSGHRELLQGARNGWKTETQSEGFNSTWESGYLFPPCEYVELRVPLG